MNGTKWIIVAAAAATVVTTLAPAAGPSALGRWRLVEQTYEKGQSNLASSERPLRLELESRPDGVAGMIWAEDGAEVRATWPAFATDAGFLPIDLVARRMRSDGAVEAIYRVRPSPTDDLVLEIRETYEPSPDGAELTGTMEVTFAGGTTHRGGYTLHRRFVRDR